MGPQTAVRISAPPHVRVFPRSLSFPISLPNGTSNSAQNPQGCCEPWTVIVSPQRGSRHSGSAG